MTSDTRALYLHSVLTCRSGSGVLLSLIYSEMLKTLRVCGFLDFDVEIYNPCDYFSFPAGYQKQKFKFSDQPHILSSKLLLVEILRNLKQAFWPFQYGHPSNLFLRAAYAANHPFGPIISGESSSKSYGGFEMASAKAAQHRLGRGVWTCAHFGDMRRALAACERLIILDTEPKDLRDYAVLLYHCGQYEDCSEYLKLYQNAQISAAQIRDEFEEDTVKKLAARVNLILAEKGWNKQTIHQSFWNSSEPCRELRNRKITAMFQAKKPGKLKKGWLVVIIGVDGDEENSGDGCQRFPIPITYLHHPRFQHLLEAAHDAYGYVITGPLRLPCSVDEFLRLRRLVEREFQRWRR